MNAQRSFTSKKNACTGVRMFYVNYRHGKGSRWKEKGRGKAPVYSQTKTLSFRSCPSYPLQAVMLGSL